MGRRRRRVLGSMRLKGQKVFTGRFLKHCAPKKVLVPSLAYIVFVSNRGLIRNILTCLMALWERDGPFFRLSAAAR